MTDCLDSWAVLQWLEGTEPAASRVDVALMGRALMSWINLGEVSYLIERRQGELRAREVVRELRAQLNLDLPTETRILQAAHIKARYPVAYADAFALATAAAHQASLLTGDPEILENPDPSWVTEDLRRSGTA